MQLEISQREKEQIHQALCNRKMILTRVIETSEGTGVLHRLSKSGRTNAKCKQQLKVVNDLINLTGTL